MLLLLFNEKRKEITHFHFYYARQKLTCEIVEGRANVECGEKYFALTHGIMSGMYHQYKGNG
jgi:hypothetical protein